VRRREFFLVLCSAVAATTQRAIGAQQTGLPVIGFISSGSPEEREALVAAFRQGLRQEGYIEGQNVAIEFRWAEGHYNRLPSLATDLVRLHVAVIAATGSLMPAQAAKAATSEIPIVFEGGGGDPVKLGLVASLGRPRGNLTGITNIASSLDAKRLALLHELVPKASVIGVLVNPHVSDAATLVRDVETAAHDIGQRIEIRDASSASEIEEAFDIFYQERVGALHIGSDPLFMSQRGQIIALAARYGIPTSYFFREFAQAGGLISYGVSLPDMYRQAGVYVGRILKGAKPEELPVLQPTKIELIINLKTAKALGLTVPASLLAQADEVIE
jgi:putative tryptophan/tyrosine transport system substrate-binding protein